MAVSVAVVGAGTWGLALAAGAARAGSETFLYSRKEGGLALPKGVQQIHKLSDVGKRARVIVLAVPSGVTREIARTLGDGIDGRHLVVHGIRGLEGDALNPVSEVVRQETPARRVGAIGGPALADDLLAGKPSVLVSGSNFPEVNEAMVAALGSPTLRIYTTGDLRGLEWASALIGGLVIGIGAAQEIGTSPGLVAAVISRGVEEAARIAAAAGGEERTLLGLAGYGDLLASIEQAERPEVILGRALARGKTLEDATKEARMRIEAVELVPRVVQWAKDRQVDVPIFDALARSIFGKAKIAEIIRELMTNPMRK
jgi:glycerol-3-phosphate dehydrogenase (NAD(P)+)